MFAEFRTFIARGNVLDLAVAVIIGAAFGKIVTSLTEDLIMPLIGFVTGGADFSSHFVLLGPIPDKYAGSLTDYAALKKAGAALFGWGQFVTVVIDFLIVAFVIFLIVRAMNKYAAKLLAVSTPVAAPAAPAADVELLTEILAELKKRPL